jgi:two-component system phosphate regulon sensor histidine kinase PhoR
LILAGLSLFFITLSIFLYLRVRKSEKELSLLETAYKAVQARGDEALRAEREYYESLLDQIPAGIIIVGKTGKITYSNTAAEKLLITRKRDLKRLPLSRFAVDFELSKRLTEALEGKEVVREINIARPQERILRARIRPIPENGKVQGAVAVLEDVTKLRRLEQTRQEFISSFSHELRTPIASCQATLEALLEWEADRDPKEREKFLKNLSQQMEHLSSLITKMLQLTKLESGASILKKSKARADDLIDKALSAVRAQAQAKGVNLERAVSPGIFVKVDHELFVQALINLLDNAIKYTQSGGLVLIEAREADNQVFFSVTDTGQGIPKDALPHIFERFYRVDKHRSREEGGTGLGLALTKHIVEAHKGKIAVESALYDSSTFTISLKRSSKS